MHFKSNPSIRGWVWFLELLQKSLDLNNREGITLMPDMQKGLIEADKYVLPDVMHKFCMRHIKANWRKREKKSKQMTKLLWWCSWSTYKEELDDHLKSLAELSEEAKEHLLHFPIQTWCRVYFDTVCKNQKVENNLVESFNSWILEERQKPIIGMLEAIRLKVMNKFVKHEEEVMSWPTEWSPTTIEMYNEYLKIANVCELNFNGDHGFEISEGNDSTLSIYQVKGVVIGYGILLEFHVPMQSRHFFTKGLIPRNKSTDGTQRRHISFLTIQSYNQCLGQNSRKLFQKKQWNHLLL